MDFDSVPPDGRGSATGQVLVAPARIPAVSAGPVFFMFVLPQIVDILRETAVHPVPFSPPHLPGIARWRGRVVPVLDLEGCLKLAPGKKAEPTRMVVIRTRHAPVGAILKLDPGLRLIPSPVDARTAGRNIGGSPDLIRGLYEWREGLLIVPHLENILSGTFAI